MTLQFAEPLPDNIYYFKQSLMKKLYYLFLCFITTAATSVAQSPANGGFENGTTGWTTGGTAGTTNARTGLKALIHTTASSSNVGHSNSSVISVPAGNYAHVVGWAIGNNSSSRACCGGTMGTSTSSAAVAIIGTTLTRLTYSVQNTTGTAQNFSCRVNTRSFNSVSTTVYWDDIIMYTATSGIPDTVKPASATAFTTDSHSASSIQFSWTNGIDTGTGIQNTIILRTTNLSAGIPIMNDQGVYSTAGGTAGPNTVSSDWAVLSASEAATATSYTDNTVAQGASYKYAVIHRDLAYNYSGALVSGTITAISNGAPLLSANVLASFGAVCTGSTAINSFQLNGTNLDGSNVTVGPLTGYSFSTTLNGTYTASLLITGYGTAITNQDIYVKFLPAVVQSYNGNVPVSGGGASGINVTATGAGITVPVQPSVITSGNASCIGVAGTIYSVSGVPGTSYTWTVPAGWSITSGQGTDSITVTVGSTAGIIDVVPSNACGSGSSQSLSVTPAAAPLNDACVNAVTLIPGATASSGNIACASGTNAAMVKNDVWYIFTTTCTGNHTITVNFLSGADIDFEVYSASSCPATTANKLFSSTTVGGVSETNTSPYTGGITYYIRVIDVNANAGNFTIGITAANNPVLTLTNTGSPAAGNISVGTSNISLFGFQVTPSACVGSYDLSALSLTTTGTATTNDLNNFRIVYDADGNGVMNGAEGSITGAGQSLNGPLNFTFSGQTQLNGTRKYILVADAPAGATGGNTFSAGITAAANLTAMITPSGSVTGSANGNTMVLTYPAPAVPMASGITSSGFDVSWVTVNGATGYKLDVATDNLFANTVTSYSNLSVSGTLQSVSGLSANTTYYFRLRAVFPNGTSANSGTGTQVTAALSAPVATAATSLSDNSFTANWNAVAGATDYRIDVSTSPFFSTAANAPDIFISEYVEGSVNNKYIELFNGTGSLVNLSNYELRVYSNGSTTFTAIALSGMLASGSTIVVKHSSATIYSGTATSAGTGLSYGGNDAIALWNLVTGNAADIFGRIGENPGTAWTTGGGYSTQDKTLVRKSTVVSGVTVNPTSGFPALNTEWDVFAMDDVTNLGSHTFNATVPSYLQGYSDLAVNGTSQQVTGALPNTNYYYRVRAVSPASTSAHSDTIVVPTNYDQSTTTYRSVQSGSFTDASSWEYNTNGANYAPATQAPGAANSIVIQSGHVVDINANSTQAISDIHIDSGGAIAIGNNSVLDVKGNLVNNGAITGNGKALFSSNTVQSISGMGAIDNMEVNNSAGVTIASGSNKLSVNGLLEVTAGQLTTNDNLVLRSTASGTAAVGPVSGGIAGNVAVERYIPAKRGWRLVCAPLKGSTNNSVKYNWLNNLVDDGVSGAEVWAPNTGVNGIVQAGASSSMRVYDNTNDVYYAVRDGDTALFSNAGSVPFMQFITGPYGSGNIANGATATTLRATGSLITGTSNISYSPAAGKPFQLIANPYACAVDFDATYSHSTNILQKFYAINPNVNTYGGYVTGIFLGGSWNYTPAGTAQNQYIQSGQAFFVEADATGVANGTATVQFQEADKETAASNNNIPVFRVNGGQFEKLIVNLKSVPATGTAAVIDGTLAVCHQTFSNGIDPSEDALKFSNFNENLFIRNNNTSLAIEGRTLYDDGDTLMLGMSNMRQGNFQLEFTPVNMSASGLTATLYDNYLNTQSVVNLSGITSYPFTVNSTTGSSSPNRFAVVFHTANPLTLTFINVLAATNQGKTTISWQVTNEDNITTYILQKSLDGKTFDNVTTVNADKSGSYRGYDDHAAGSLVYYCVEAIEKRGKKVYSKVIGLSNMASQSISVYPNPVKDNTVKVLLSGLTQGDYILSVLNSSGRQMQQLNIAHSAGTENILLNVSSLIPGIYELKLMDIYGHITATQKLIKQ